MGRMTRAGAAAAAVVLMMGLAACGDDDDDASTDTTTEDAAGGDGEAAGGDVEAFCGALVEFNGAVNQVELDEESTEDEVKAAGEELAPTFQEMVDNAPEAVADDAEELNDTAIKPLLDGDAEAFNADETFATYTELVEAATPECDFQELAVTAVDYAFEGAPATLAAGTYSALLTNEGNEQHEMIVFRKADGVTESIPELLELPEEEAETKIAFAGAAFAPPGESGGSLIELEPGQYGMVCFIPVGTTADVDPEAAEGGESGPPHFTQGMLTEFTVQ